MALAFALLALGYALKAQSADVLIEQGDSLLVLDKPQKAVDKFTAAIEKAPSASAYSARARAWYHMERMDRFLLDVEKALALDSTHAEANLQRAMYCFRGEDHAGAERYANVGLRHPKDPALRDRTLVLRGQARAERRRYPEAAKDLKEGLGERTDDPQALKSMARVLDALGDHAGSLGVLEKLCAVEPFDIGNWTNRGFELAALGRFEESLAVYGEALALDKDEPTVLSNRANSLMQLGREAEALSDVERSLKSYPSNAYALRTRGLLYARKGLKEKACNDLQLAKIIGGVSDIDKIIEDHCAGVPMK